MNGKLVVQLSLVGLAMALATVYVVPPRVESLCWPLLFAGYALLIAHRAPGRPFLHGFLVGLANWGWVSAAHLTLHEAYFVRHADELAAIASRPMPRLPLPLRPYVLPFVHLARARNLPVPGASGVVTGAFAWIASRFVGPGRTAPRNG